MYSVKVPYNTTMSSNRSRLEPVLYFSSIHKYIKSRTFRKDLPKNQHDRIRKASRHYVENGGRLYYVTKEGTQRLALATREDQEKALYESHNQNKHSGERRMLLALDAKYYWISMVKDVKNWLQSCDYCQNVKKKKPMVKEVMPIVANEPWELIGMDVLGPFATTESEHRFIFITTDVYSNFVYAKAVKQKAPEEVCRVIEELFLLYGPPKRVVTDKGKDFIGKINKTLLGRWGVKHCIKAPPSTEGNEGEQDIHRNAKLILNKYTNDYLTDWDKYVKQIVYGINTMYQAEIKQTPFAVMFQREVPPPMYTNIINEIGFKEKIQELEEANGNGTSVLCYSPDDKGDASQDHTYGLINGVGDGPPPVSTDMDVTSSFINTSQEQENITSHVTLNTQQMIVKTETIHSQEYY